jgi:hypothetical protein
LHLSRPQRTRHQLGNKPTREVPTEFLTAAASSLDAWDRRTRIGPSGPAMGAFFQRLGEHRKAFADWTDRIAKGETPTTAPPRPAGVERNLVVTLWDCGLRELCRLAHRGGGHAAEGREVPDAPESAG